MKKNKKQYASLKKRTHEELRAQARRWAVP